MDNRTLLAGAGLGAALALMLDPNQGGRRRALVRDKFVRGTHVTGRTLNTTAHDVANRTRGMVAATRGRWSSEPVDDHTLIERVRARLGRIVSHPRAIDVLARDGEVTLRGPILSEEMDALVAMAEGVRGVRAVVNQLEPHDTPEGVPSLQGEGRVAGANLDLLQPNWAPATRALVGLAAVAGGAMMTAYARR